MSVDRRRPFLLVPVLLLIQANAVAGSITIAPQTSFHDWTECAYPEGTPTDNGGTLFLFVRNDGHSPDSVATVRMNGADVTAIPGYQWHRTWPETMGTTPGTRESVVTVKATSAPLAEGQTITIEVQAESGATASTSFACVTPRLRLANVIPAKDLESVLFYVRNDDSVPHTLQGLHWRGQDYAIGAPGLSVMGGNYVVAPGNVAILRLAQTNPPEMVQSTVGVASTRDDASQPQWVGALVHLIEPIFALGAWSGDLPQSETGLAIAKQAHFNTVMGGGSWDDVGRMYRDYRIRCMRFIGEPPTPPVSEMQANTDNDALRIWMVKDEPEWSNSGSQVAQANQLFWKNDPNHPTFLTLARAKTFGNYATIPSVICVDHYAAYSAPNSVPGTWFLRKAPLDESHAFFEALKANSEPIRPWCWVQMCAAGTWGTQPLPWAQNYQWWGNVMKGAKGLLWFVYDPGYETNPEVADNVAEGLTLTRELSQVQNLCLYGEPVAVENQSTADVVAGALVGPEAMVVVVLNDGYQIGGLAFSPSYSIAPTDYSVTVHVPDWIHVDSVYRVTDGGSVAAPYSVSGSSVTIGPLTVEQRSHVFVIGPADTTPPATPEELTVAKFQNLGNFTLTWKDSWDSFGVKGYKIFADGEEIGDVRHAMFTVSGRVAGSSYTVAAYDAAGNLSPPSKPYDADKPAFWWEFNTEGDTEGWGDSGVSAGISEIQATNGSLRIDYSGPDPYLDVPLPGPILTTKYRWAVIRMRNASSGNSLQFHFSRGYRYFDIVPNDPEFTVYAVDMSTPTDGLWRGYEIWLRFDPQQDGPSGYGLIDYVRFTGTDPSTDTDHDGLGDYEEDTNGNGIFDDDDLSSFQAVDTDGDGMNDYDEALAGYNRRNPNIPDLSLDVVSDVEATALSPYAVRLTWTYHDSGHVGFRIERADNGGSFVLRGIVNDGVTSYEDGLLQPNTTYAYRLQAFNDLAESSWSPTISVATINGMPLPLSAAVSFGIMVALATVGGSALKSAFPARTE